MCDLCGKAHHLSSFTAFFCDQEATTFNQCALDIVAEIKGYADELMDDLLEDRFVNMFKDTNAGATYEICYRCAGLLQFRNEEWYVEKAVTIVTGSNAAGTYTKRKDLRLKSTWKNYSWRSKYPTTPNSTCKQLTKYLEKTQDFLAGLMSKRTMQDCEKETEETRHHRRVCMLVVKLLTDPLNHDYVCGSHFWLVCE